MSSEELFPASGNKTTAVGDNGKTAEGDFVGRIRRAAAYSVFIFRFSFLISG